MEKYHCLICLSIYRTISLRLNSDICLSNQIILFPQVFHLNNQTWKWNSYNSGCKVILLVLVLRITKQDENLKLNLLNRNAISLDSFWIKLGESFIKFFNWMRNSSTTEWFGWFFALQNYTNKKKHVRFLSLRNCK